MLMALIQDQLHLTNKNSSLNNQVGCKVFSKLSLLLLLSRF